MIEDKINLKYSPFKMFVYLDPICTPITEPNNNIVASTIAICSIELVHVQEDIYDKESGTIFSQKLQPISRLGGIDYSTLGDIISIPRPKV